MPKLNTCELPGCSNPCRERFCCTAHYKSYVSRRNKQVRAAIKAAKVVICGYCKKRVKNPHSNQKFHHGECQNLGSQARRQDGYVKKRKEIKIITMTCECGQVFETAETNTARKYCRNPKCTYARQVRIKAARVKAGTWVERKRKPAPKIDDPYRIEFVDIMAQCPTCGEKHKQRVVKGSGKWIYCDKHIGNRDYAQTATTSTSLHRMMEY